MRICKSQIIIYICLNITNLQALRAECARKCMLLNMFEIPKLSYSSTMQIRLPNE